MTRPTSLKPGGKRPFRAEIGFDARGFVRVSLYALCSFVPRISLNASWRWEARQLVLVLNQRFAEAKAVAAPGDVETSMRFAERELDVQHELARFGWRSP